MTHGQRAMLVGKSLSVALILLGLVLASGSAAARSDAEVQAWFNVLDADGDGVGQWTEYEMREVEVLFRRDGNGDGHLAPEETRLSRPGFDRLDGDGQLSGVELIRARELQFTRVDRDGDGALTIEELDALRDELLQ